MRLLGVVKNPNELERRYRDHGRPGFGQSAGVCDDVRPTRARTNPFAMPCEHEDPVDSRGAKRPLAELWRDWEEIHLDGSPLESRQ